MIILLTGGKQRKTIAARATSRGPHLRRLMKELAYRYLPCRPLFTFLWMYVVRAGFLDGAGRLPILPAQVGGGLPDQSQTVGTARESEYEGCGRRFQTHCAWGLIRVRGPARNVGTINELVRLQPCSEMCGIAGALNWGDACTVERMAQVLAHRGPDDLGVEYFPAERVGLSHRRLSILDLSPAGHQPMSCRGGRLWIVFNGEIYNFQELRADLEKRQHRFCSNTDTEVILHLYEEAGAECVTRLNGMFAFAILDRDARKVLLARDHFGIKPLYYYDSGGHFVFASEIKAILASNCCAREIDLQSLYDFFTFSCVPCPQTIFKGIKQLPPAHTLEMSLDTGISALSRYWDAGALPSDGGILPHDEAMARLRQLLGESVRRQLVSDVPVGAFLSGGVDSRIMVGLMAEAARKPVKTFTVVFEGYGLEYYNEREAARQAAERFGTEHHEMAVRVDQPEEMLDMVRYFDQPFANPTAYLMHLISRQARGEVKVALCGAGGDELFAGYPRYRAIGLAKLFRYAPDWTIQAARTLLRDVAGRLPHHETAESAPVL